MFRRITLVIISIIASIYLSPSQATAEEIPVLVWESGQSQNVVLGKGDYQSTWKIYLKSLDGQKYELSKSLANQDSFEVFTINLPENFPIGGYVVEAIDDNGSIKQVAGVQIVKASSKEVTRIPFELFFTLGGFSLFFFYLNKIKQIRRIRIQENLNFDLELINIFDLPFRFKSSLEAGKSISLARVLALDETRFDMKLTRLSLVGGIFGIGLISWLQFSKSNWMTGNSLLILLLLLIGNLFFTYGLVFSILAISYLLLNIASAKSIAEVISYFVICGTFFLPALYNQFLSKLLVAKDGYSRIKFSRANLLSALIAALSGYQLIILFESLAINSLSSGFSKEIFGVLLIGIFLLKNILNRSQSENYSEFEVVRAIGPTWSAGLGLLISLIVYIWTTNLLVSIVALISVLLILTTSWLKIDSLQRFSLPNPDLYFGSILIVVVLVALYLSTQALPLDVINRSHLSIILIFPFDLLLALYMWINFNGSQNEESSIQSKAKEILA